MDFDRSDISTASYPCRRRDERHRLLYAGEAFIEFVGSDGRRWKLELLSVSSDGLGFGLQDGQPMLERGSKIDRIAVRIANASIDGMLRIAHATQEFAAGTICGAQFEPATEADGRKLKEAIAALGW